MFLFSKIELSAHCPPCTRDTIVKPVFKSTPQWQSYTQGHKWWILATMSKRSDFNSYFSYFFSIHSISSALFDSQLPAAMSDTSDSLISSGRRVSYLYSQWEVIALNKVTEAEKQVLIVLLTSWRKTSRHDKTSLIMSSLRLNHNKQVSHKLSLVKQQPVSDISAISLHLSLSVCTKMPCKSLCGKFFPQFHCSNSLHLSFPCIRLKFNYCKLQCCDIDGKGQEEPSVWSRTELVSNVFMCLCCPYKNQSVTTCSGVTESKSAYTSKPRTI